MRTAVLLIYSKLAQTEHICFHFYYLNDMNLLGDPEKKGKEPFKGVMCTSEDDLK